MEFGYFTLSDNHYENNTRDANQFVADITDEALYADELGMHSAWIGEHHFNSLGVLSCPDLVLAYIAARTKHIRLAPAVTVLPLHHPIRVAEQWATLDLLSRRARRFRRRPRLRRARIPAVQRRRSTTTRASSRRAWSSCASCGRRTAASRITASTISSTMCASRRSRCSSRCPPMSASFSKPSIELAARLGCGLIVAPFAAAMSFGGLKQVADLYHETCAKYGTKPGRLMCSYFTHFADNKAAGGRAARAPDPLLQGMRDPGLPGRSEDRAAELPLLHRHGGRGCRR